MPAPTQIGRYQVIRLLGQGGMASVYLAHDPEIGRDIAVKLLPAQFTHDSQFLARFRREARTIANLEHPAIVPIYDFGQHDTQPYLVMRYMPGGSLEEKLAGGKALSPAEAASFLERLAPALDQVHRQGIVHRDLKPGNILFDNLNQPYLSDFGIVKLGEGGGSASLTASGGTLGTPAYMSPEQARGTSDIDGRSDIYSLGVILYQMLTGELPFKADTPIGLAVAHINDPVPDVLSTNPSLPPGSSVIVSRAMAKDPGQRYPSASAMAAAMKSLDSGSAMAQDSTVLDAPVAAAALGTAGVAQSTAQDAEAAPAVTQVGRSRRWIGGALGCLGLVALLAVAGIYAASLGGLSFLSSLGGQAEPEPTTAAVAVAATETVEPTLAAVSSETAQPTTEAVPTQSPTPLPTPVPPIGSSNTYVEYILDASGSMLESLEDRTKLEIAQEMLTSRVRTLPPDINVGLRVYGHRLRWQDDEEASCRDIELVVPLGPGGSGPIVDWLPTMQAQGMTPMTESIRQAAEDFTFDDERNNLIVLLSDGIETCDEEPAEAVQLLQELGIDFTVHVIGLAVDQQAREQLQALASVAGGTYHDADSAEDLASALSDVNEVIVEEAAADATAEAQSPTPSASPSSTVSPAPTATGTAALTATPIPSPTLVPPSATPTIAPSATNVPATDTPVPPDTPTSTVAAQGQIVNATFDGKVGASSTYSGFPATMAVDGNRATSWFSAGSEADPNGSTFQWSGQTDEMITSISVLSNSQNAEPDFRTGFGFEFVSIQVVNSAGEAVYTSRASLAGTPDPDVTFEPNVVGRDIILNFSGHESPDCGGFSELVVMVER